MYAVDELIDNPEMAIRAFTALKEEREKNRLLQEKNERMKPHAILGTCDHICKYINFSWGISQNS